jgi:hypothetical protein
LVVLEDWALVAQDWEEMVQVLRELDWVQEAQEEQRFDSHCPIQVLANRKTLTKQL